MIYSVITKISSTNSYDYHSELDVVNKPSLNIKKIKKMLKKKNNLEKSIGNVNKLVYRNKRHFKYTQESHDIVMPDQNYIQIKKYYNNFETMKILKNEFDKIDSYRLINFEELLSFQCAHYKDCDKEQRFYEYILNRTGPPTPKILASLKKKYLNHQRKYIKHMMGKETIEPISSYLIEDIKSIKQDTHNSFYSGLVNIIHVILKFIDYYILNFQFMLLISYIKKGLTQKVKKYN